MQRILLFTAMVCLVLSSCSKDETTTNNNTTPTSVNGSFKISYDSTKYKIDSMRTYYLNTAGTLDSATVRGVSTWTSPARLYKSGDSAYARVFAWGTGPAVGLPGFSFSESVVTKTASSSTGSSIKSGKIGFTASSGFRLQ